MNYRISLKILCGFLAFGIVFLNISKEETAEEIHLNFLENSPYKETSKLSKKERFNAGLPPDKFYEQLYDLTMDPSTGMPDIATKIDVSRKLEYRKENQVLRQAVPGQSTDTPWSSIGPNNEAGRTRAALFDLNDAELDRVIAGGVSGGLWVNEDIDNVSIPNWTQITGVPGNLSVSNIVQDPDDNNIMFVGTGESYTSGDVNGNGIYRSTDGGFNWISVFGSSSGIVSSTYDINNSAWLVEGYFFINDLVIYDNDLADSSNPKWIYAALGYTVNSRMSPNTLQDLFEMGLYRSQDNGETWAKISDSDLYFSPSIGLNINDIEIQEGTNRIWLSTTNSINSTEGGQFFYSDDGTNFIEVSPSYNTTPTSVGRTEIASSHQNAGTHYVLMSANSQAEIYKTTDNFVNLSKLSEPNDEDTEIPATDFTRGQSFYDLEIEVDPSDDSVVYVGGIDWFRSADGGTNWSQITKWSNNNDLGSLNVSEIHADQHGLYFRPGLQNQAIIVNDGGVAYCSDLAGASSGPRFIEAEGNYITTQFYNVAQSPPSFSKDWIIGGTQDNGTYRFDSPGSTPSPGLSTDPGGDGAYTFFDQVGGDYAISNYVYNNSITRLSFNGSGQYTGSYDISDAISVPSEEGSFINPAALDSNKDVYFSDGTPYGTSDYNIRVITNLTNSPPSLNSISGLPSRATTLEVSPYNTDSSTLLVGTRGGDIIKITDANTGTPSDITLPKPGLGSVSDIHFGETEDDLFVTYYNYGSSIINVFYSANGGASWTPKEGDLPDLPVYSIQHNPFEEDEVIVGTELGIWKTSNFTDANPNWTLAYEGMSDVAVLNLDYRGTSAMDNRVLAATFGRGVYVGSFRANTNPPISATDSITLAEGGTAITTTGGATSVLSNDYDPDGDSISTGNVTTTLNGILTLAPSGTGSFTYVHDGSETTTDTFFYNANDGSVNGNTVSVTITISAVPDCPSIVNPLSDFSATEDDPDSIIDFSNVFDDPDTLNLSYTVTNTNPALLTASINTTSLTLDYVDNMTGNATITIMANDASCGSLVSESFLVTVSEVNDSPTGIADVIQVNEGGTVTMTTVSSTVLANDTDTDTPIASLTVGIGVGAITPTVAKSSNFNFLNNGTFTYTHDGTQTPGDANTTDVFYYRPHDGTSFGNTTTVTIQITHINDCPVEANPISNRTDMEDDADLDIDVSSIFTDEELDAISLTVSNTNTGLLSAVLSSATLTIDYIDNMTGSSTIILYATDNSIECSALVSSSFVITVIPQNDTPVGVSDIINVNEGATATMTTVSSTVLANDTDTEGDNLSILSFTQPLYNSGTFPLQSNGTFIYTHDGSETTTDTFNYELTDGSTTTVVSVTININSVNDCPVVASPLLDINVNEDAPDTIINILSNFSDAENNSLSFTVSNTNTALAAVTLNTTTLTIDYSADTNGTSTVIIYVDDLNGCSTLQESFLINVSAVNDMPIGVPDIINVNEGATATMTTVSSTVLANDTDTEGDNLSILSFTQPLYNSGTFPLQSNGTFVYTHDGSETTTDTFDYVLTDGNTTSVVSVTINISPINDCPIVVTPFSDITTNEDSSDYILNILSNFSDPENNSLSFMVSNTNTSLINVTLNTNTLTISIIPNANGTATVTIYVDDLNGCSTLQESFAINVTAVNDPPVTITDTIFVIEGGTVSLTTASNTSLLDNDTDTEGNALEAQMVSSTTNGVLVLSSTGTFTYTHNGSETTTDAFTYRAAEISGQDGNTITVNINIQEINDCPTVTENPPISFSYPEDTSNWGYTYNVFITDDDGGTPIYTLTNIGTDLITAQITNQANGSVQIYPVLNQHGTTTMTLNVNDTRGCDLDILIPVTLTPVNDCPTLDNPIADISATEDDPDLYIPLANVFSDIDSDTLTYSSYVGDSTKIASSITATALVVSYLPNQNGSTYISLMVSDGDINCTVDDLITVSITQTNDAPSGLEDFISVSSGGTVIVLNDGATNSVLANDIDPEGDAITAVEVLAPVNGSLTLLADGTFTYTHDGSATTTDVFTYTPRDNFSIGNTTTVTIYINDLPVGVTETIALFEGGTASTTTNAATSVLVNDTDANAGDAALLTASIGTSPLHGTLSLNGNGSFVYNHGGTENFSDSFTYIPYDGKGYGLPTSVSITITPTNDAPIAYPDNITVGLGGTANFLTNGVDNVLLNDLDTDGDVMTVSLVSSPTFGTLILNPGGTFSYVQNGVMNGGDSFTYKANDGTVDSNVVAVNIDLTCSPCTQSTIVGGSNGVFFNYQGCDCNSYQVFVPKGKSYTFCHLDNSIAISQGAYTVIATSVCN